MNHVKFYIIPYINFNQEFGKEKIPGGYSSQRKLNNKGETWEKKFWDVVFAEAEKWEGMLGRRHNVSDGPEAGRNSHKCKIMEKIENQSREQREKVGQVW